MPAIRLDIVFVSFIVRAILAGILLAPAQKSNTYHDTPNSIIAPFCFGWWLIPLCLHPRYTTHQSNYCAHQTPNSNERCSDVHRECNPSLSLSLILPALFYSSSTSQPRISFSNHLGVGRSRNCNFSSFHFSWTIKLQNCHSQLSSIFCFGCANMDGQNVGRPFPKMVH